MAFLLAPVLSLFFLQLGALAPVFLLVQVLLQFLVAGRNLLIAELMGLVFVDPGSSKMRNSLRRRLDAQPLTIHTVTATHHHEEHSGNLAWLSSRLKADLLLAPKTCERLRTLRLPWMRRLTIGQPVPLTVS